MARVCDLAKFVTLDDIISWYGSSQSPVKEST